MEQTTERINIRGAINLLELDGSTIKLAKCDYKLSSVRATVVTLANDTGKKFSVTTSKETIIVTRIS